MRGLKRRRNPYIRGEPGSQEEAVGGWVLREGAKRTYFIKIGLKFVLQFTNSFLQDLGRSQEEAIGGWSGRDPDNQNGFIPLK